MPRADRAKCFLLRTSSCHGDQNALARVHSGYFPASPSRSTRGFLYPLCYRDLATLVKVGGLGEFLTSKPFHTQPPLICQLPFRWSYQSVSSGSIQFCVLQRGLSLVDRRGVIVCQLLIIFLLVKITVKIPSSCWGWKRMAMLDNCTS